MLADESYNKICQKVNFDCETLNFRLLVQDTIYWPKRLKGLDFLICLLYIMFKPIVSKGQTSSNCGTQSRQVYYQCRITGSNWLKNWQIDGWTAFEY